MIFRLIQSSVFVLSMCACLWVDFLSSYFHDCWYFIHVFTASPACSLSVMIVGFLSYLFLHFASACMLLAYWFVDIRFTLTFRLGTSVYCFLWRVYLNHEPLPAYFTAPLHLFQRWQNRIYERVWTWNETSQSEFCFQDTKTSLLLSCPVLVCECVCYNYYHDFGSSRWYWEARFSSGKLSRSIPDDDGFCRDFQVLCSTEPFLNSLIADRKYSWRFARSLTDTTTCERFLPTYLACGTRGSLADSVVRVVVIVMVVVVFTQDRGTNNKLMIWTTKYDDDNNDDEHDDNDNDDDDNTPVSLFHVSFSEVKTVPTGSRNLCYGIPVPTVTTANATTTTTTTSNAEDARREFCFSVPRSSVYLSHTPHERYWWKQKWATLQR